MRVIGAKRMRGMRAAALLGVLVGAACDDPRHTEIRRDIHVITTRNDALVDAAMKRLGARGPLALTQIESAMHAASSKARLRLVAVMDTIAHPDAAALLRHWAFYAPEPEVRTACDAVLAHWSRAQDERGEKARAAQQWLNRRGTGDYLPTRKIEN